MKMLLLCMIALTGCAPADDEAAARSATNVADTSALGSQPGRKKAGTSFKTVKYLPEKYLKALVCDFDEAPIAARTRAHETPAGRAERVDELKLLRSLGFSTEGRDGGLGSTGGKISAPPGLTILGLPVRSVEINGMIGDANAMYVTTFADSVTVDQVVNAARLTMARDLYEKYKIRHYSKRLNSNPSTALYLDDRGGDKAVLVCQVQSTPD